MAFNIIITIIVGYLALSDASSTIKKEHSEVNLKSANKRVVAAAGAIVAVTSGTFSVLNGVLNGAVGSRVVAIALSNFADKALVYPEVLIESGNSQQVLPKRIEPGEAAILRFEKTPMAMVGTEGLITYKVEGKENYLTIYWDVPYNYIFGATNRFFVGLSEEADHLALYDICRERSYSAGKFKWQLIKYSKWGFKMESAMTNAAKAAMEVHFQNSYLNQ